MLPIIRTVAEFRESRKYASRNGETMGLVPTMGALHDGHISLVEAAARENRHVCVSIYVNPTQFGANEDLSTYPRTLADDVEKLERINERLEQMNYQGRVLSVFVPDNEEMYPHLPPSSAADAAGSFIEILPLAKVYEGHSRPTFFRGVATVCMKLFNIVLPDRAYFGQKDIQQVLVIKRMIKDFHLLVEIRVCPIVREGSLPMSSRNRYLGPQRREAASGLSSALLKAQEQCQKSLNPMSALAHALKDIELHRSEWASRQEAGCSIFELDYLSLVHGETFEKVTSDEIPGTGAYIIGAAKILPLIEPTEREHFGLGADSIPVRIIDNVYVGPNVRG